MRFSVPSMEVMPCRPSELRASGWVQTADEFVESPDFGDNKLYPERRQWLATFFRKYASVRPAAIHVVSQAQRRICTKYGMDQHRMPKPIS